MRRTLTWPAPSREDGTGDSPADEPWAVTVARGQVADFLARLLKLAGLRLSDMCDRINCAPVDRGLLLAQVQPLTGSRI